MGALRKTASKVLVVLLAPWFLACGGQGTTSSTPLQVFLHGPPSGEFEDLDPFESCSFVKLCYRLEGKAGLEDCKYFEHAAGEASGLKLPFDESVVVVAECYDSDPHEATPTPLNLLGRGESTPITRGEDDEASMVSIYMLPVSSFGPTYTPDPVGAQGGGIVTAPFTTRWGAAVAELYDGRLLLAGGVDDFDSGCDDWSDPGCVENANSSAELYDPADGDFTLVGAGTAQLLSERRAFAAAAALPTGEIAIFGGITTNGEPTNTVDIFDPISMTFTPGSPMQETRAFHTATLISNAEAGYVLVAGGYGTGEGSFEIWTGAQGAVASGALHDSRWNHTATLVDKAVDPGVERNMVVIAGGEGGGSPGTASVRSTMEIFDIDNQALDSATDLCTDGPGYGSSAARTLHAAAFVLKRHFLYVAGGFSDGAHEMPAKDICVWHAKSETWQGGTGSFMLDNGRGALSATALPGNVVLLAGGLTMQNGYLKPAETTELIFEYMNEKGATVVDIGPDSGFPIPMLEPRWHHTAFPTSDGKVLFVGGVKGDAQSPQMADSSELFNPQ